ncbi:MAG: hypothetical protein KAH48_09270, partial [Chlorobi bacterium]|nr:hypothetical protein [Chlorobiota bacterium]
MKKLNQIKSVARHTSTALLAVLIMFSARLAEAQTDNVGIGTVTPDNSSILDLTSTSRGFLTPRMTVVQRNSITTPVVGLMIYQTNDTPGFYYYNGTSWIKISDVLAGVITGGGTDGQLSFWTSATVISGSSDLFWDNVNNRLGIGTATPNTDLDVEGTAILGSPTSPPADADFNLSQWTLWLDEPNNEFELRAKKSDGTVIAQTVGDVNPGGNTGEMQFNNVGSFGASSNLFWDISNSRFGIGTNSPDADLDVEGIVLLGAPSAPVAEGDFANSQWNLWLDETNDEFELKARKTDGSFITQTVGNVTPGGNSGQMQYNDAGAFGASSNLVWDNTNVRLGVGNSSPVDRIDLRDASGNGGIRVANSVVSQEGVIRWTGTDFEGYTGSTWASFTATGGGGGDGDVWATDGSNGRVAFFNSSRTITGTDAFFWDNNNERLGIGAGLPSADLDVEGTALLGAPIAAPADAVFANSQWTVWLDETNNEFEIKAKKSDGSILNKTIASVAGNVGEIQYNGGTGFAASSNLIWDNTNVRLGIGAGAPSVNLDVVGTAILGAPNAAPADGVFAVSQWSLWLDEPNNEFELKAKKSDGTVISQTVSAGTQSAGSFGEIQYNDGINGFAASSNLVWDNLYARLGIGGGSPSAELDVVGTVILGAPNAAPADASFANSQWSLWLDESSSEFELKAKTSTGSIITQTIGSTAPAGNNSEIQYNDAGAFGASSNYIWDNTNTRLGIGAGAPTTTIDAVGGSALLPAPTAAPADADLEDSQWTLWLDESNDEFELKAKKSGGTVITQTIGSGGGTPAGNSGEIQFNISGAFDASTDLIWDDANSRLGIGAGAPSADLDVVGTAILGAPNAAPADATLANSQWTFWIDETNDDFEIKAKKADGTVLTKTV